MCDVAWQHKQYINKYSDQKSFKVITSNHSKKECASACCKHVVKSWLLRVEDEGKTQWHVNLLITLSRRRCDVASKGLDKILMFDVFFKISRKLPMVDENLDILFDAYSDDEEDRMSMDELFTKALESVEICRKKLDRIQHTE